MKCMYIYTSTVQHLILSTNGRIMTMSICLYKNYDEVSFAFNLVKK